MTVSNTKQNVIQYFDSFENYGIYYKGPWWFYRNRYANVLNEHLKGKQGIKVLDLGCGRMCSLPGLLKEPYLLKYVCVDASSESLRELENAFKDHEKVEVCENDIKDFLRLCQEEFDVVILFGVLMYMSRKDAKEVIQQASKLLKKEGMLMISEPNENAKNHLDNHAKVFSQETMDELKLISGGMDVSIRNYNIPWLRRPVHLVFKVLRRLKKLTKINIVAVDKCFLSLESALWQSEIYLEDQLSQIRLGYDSMILLRRGKKVS